MQYPYFAPQILNDTVFLLYGGHTGTSSASQRQIAYLLAEEQATEYISSFLLPTIVTGTYFWRDENPLVLDYGNILDVKRLTFSSRDNNYSCSFSSYSGCFGRRNDEFGYLDVLSFLSCNSCSNILGLPPYTITVVYESGLSTGTATLPSVLQALVIAAQINLNEIDISLSNEGTADIGIQEFTTQQYNETRVKLSSSAFGNSAMANRAARLLKKYRCRTGLGFK